MVIRIVFIVLIYFFFGRESYHAQIQKCETPYNEHKSYPNNHAFYKRGVLQIPIVFHVLYKKNEENLSQEIVDEQLTILNQSFRKKLDLSTLENTFVPYATDTEIEFVKLQQDINGDSFDGLNYVYTNNDVFISTDIHYTNLGGADSWNNDQVLNVWVGDLSGQKVAYTKFAGSNFIEEEIGVVIDYQYFGIHAANLPDYKGGKTLVHEVGHWLGLNHLWGNGDCSSDDGIEDTPNQIGPNYSCSALNTSCGSVDFSQNFMDYSVDDCLLFFTEGQKNYMKLFLDEHYTGQFTSVKEDSFDAISNFWFKHGSLNFEHKTTLPFTLLIKDVFGRLVFQKEVNYNTIEIDLENTITKGTYIVQLVNNTNNLTKLLYNDAAM